MHWIGLGRKPEPSPLCPLARPVCPLWRKRSKTLDDAIARREAQAKAVAAGRDEALARIQNLKKLRAALSPNFTTAGWTAAVKELKRQ